MHSIRQTNLVYDFSQLAPLLNSVDFFGGAVIFRGELNALKVECGKCGI